MANAALKENVIDIVASNADDLLAQTDGRKVEVGEKEITLDTQVWMSHSDTIASVPEHFEVIASTPTVPVAAFRIRGQEKYGIQFHPEVNHTEQGVRVIDNFLKVICGCTGD